MEFGQIAIFFLIGVVALFAYFANRYLNEEVDQAMDDFQVPPQNHYIINMPDRTQQCYQPPYRDPKTGRFAKRPVRKMHVNQSAAMNM